MAKWFFQTHGVDFGETFTLVVIFVFIKTFLSIEALFDFDIDYMDIKCTFLNGELDEDFYMNNFDGYEAIGQDLVYKFEKFIYGLK